MQKKLRALCWVCGSSLLLDPTPNTSPKPHLQKVLPCRHPCHTWDLGLRTLCDAVSPNFHALNGWDCMDWPQVTWDLGLGTPCEPVLKSKAWIRIPDLTLSMSQVRNRVWVGALPTNRITVHPTTMVYPIIVGAPKWNKYYQPTMWEPLGLPLGTLGSQGMFEMGHYYSKSTKS
jgi:hypothetical protein